MGPERADKRVDRAGRQPCLSKTLGADMLDILTASPTSTVSCRRRQSFAKGGGEKRLTGSGHCRAARSKERMADVWIPD